MTINVQVPKKDIFKDILVEVQPRQSGRELVLVYGPSGVGKTRFVTSLTPRFGKIAYIALDEGSDSLDSVLEPYLDRITVFRPKFKNPVVDAIGISHRDWKAEGFDTIIVDTFSKLVKDWLWYITQHTDLTPANRVGDPDEEGSVALPDRGHYSGAQATTRNFMVNMFRHNTDINYIFVCHEYTSDKTGKMEGGPATAGHAMLSEFSGNFKTVIRLDRSAGKAIKDPKTNKLVIPERLIAHMAPHGIWDARRRESSVEGNPLPSLELEIDPINFWKKYDETSPLLKGTING